MRFFHLSDLHLGKRLQEYNLLADQLYILNQILVAIDEYQPDAVIIAGDIYDKSAPSAEAIAIFDDFLTALAKRKMTVMLISGNHDSPERLNFGGRIMAAQNIHLSGIFNGQMDKVIFDDPDGQINCYLLPFVRPSQIRRFFPDKTIDCYQDAIDTILLAQPLDPNSRNILIAHQFITAGDNLPQTTDSEQINVGSLDNIDAAAFWEFDYVALGHLHRAQSIGGENIRYAGSPLKYSFSEATHQKSLTMIELGGKGSLTTTAIPLIPERDLREIKGPLAKLISPAVVNEANHQDYLHVTLTDEADLVSPLTTLRQVYPNIMKMDFDNARTKITDGVGAAKNPKEKTLLELFAEFYNLQQDIDLTTEKQALVKQAFEQLGGEL